MNNNFDQYVSDGASHDKPICDTIEVLRDTAKLLSLVEALKQNRVDTHLRKLCGLLLRSS